MRSSGYQRAGLLLFWLGLIFTPPALEAGKTASLRPRIFLEYATRRDPVEPAKVSIWLDGVEVSAKAELGPSMVSYVPDKDLAPGLHCVEVTLTDRAGYRRSKGWEFEVDPAMDQGEWQISFVAPTPINGAVVVPSGLQLSVQGAGIDIKALEFHAYVSELGGGFRSLPGRSGVQGERWNMGFELRTQGAMSILVKAVDLNSGQSRDIQTSFAVDTQAPQVESFEVLPKPWDPQEDPELRAMVQFADPPFSAAASVELRVTGPAGEEQVLKRQDVSSPVIFSLPAEKFGSWPNGSYMAEVMVSDYAQQRSINLLPVFMEIRRSTARGPELPFSLSPFLSVVKSDRIHLLGHTMVGVRIDIWRGGKVVRTLNADRVGYFDIPGLELEEGLNAFSFLLYDMYGRSLGPEIHAPAILLDRRPPHLKSLSVESGGRLIDPRPVLRWNLEDGEGENMGSGLRADGLTVSIDGEELAVRRDESGHSTVPKADLDLGEHVLVISATDRLGNTSVIERHFVVVTGPPVHLKVEANRETLYAWGDEAVVVDVQVSDKYRRAVADGTLLRFNASQGLVPASLQTVGGRAVVRFLPGLVPGEVELKVGVEGESGQAGLEQTLKFRVLNAPQRLPVRAEVTGMRELLPADRGRTVLEGRALLFDALGEPVADGLEIALSADLGKLSQPYAVTSKGAISWTYSTGERTGPETLRLAHGPFLHEIRLELEKPKAGPPHHLEVKVLPNYVKAGGDIPLRLTVRVLDERELPVDEEVEVLFHATSGRLSELALTREGVVINNYLPPSEPGEVEISVRALQFEEKVRVKVLPSVDTDEVKRLWMQVESVWETGSASEVLNLEGQLYGDHDALLRGTRPVFVITRGGKAPLMVLAYDGLFVIPYRTDGHSGPVEMELRSGGFRQMIRFEVQSGDNLTTRKSREAPDWKNADLDLQYQIVSYAGELAQGLLSVRLAVGGNSTQESFDGEWLLFSADRGEIFPRAMLAAGQVRLPYHILADGKPGVVEVRSERGEKLLATLEIPGLVRGERKEVLPAEVKPSFSWDFRYQSPEPGSNSVRLVLEIVHGEAPGALVRLQAERGRVNPPVATWKGDRLEAWYELPAEGSFDTVTASAKDWRAELILPLVELRRQSFDPGLSLPSRENFTLLPGEFKVELISGRTQLVAGGQDKTRLKFRVADHRDVQVEDGVEVELVCPQASITPSRARTRQGTIQVTLTSQEWVGTYPLILKLAEQRRAFDITFTVPEGVSGILPELPEDPDFALPNFPGSPRGKFRLPRREKP